MAQKYKFGNLVVEDPQFEIRPIMDHMNGNATIYVQVITPNAVYKEMIGTWGYAEQLGSDTWSSAQATAWGMSQLEFYKVTFDESGNEVMPVETTAWQKAKNFFQGLFP